MQILVTATPNARKAEVMEIGGNEYKVTINARASDGKANLRLIELLSEYSKFRDHR